MFETGQILVGLGVGVIGLLRIARAIVVWRSGDGKYFRSNEGNLLYRFVGAVAYAHIAVGLILALNTYRSWAHEDDIISTIAITFALLWVSAPNNNVNGDYDNVSSSGKLEMGLSVLVQALRFACCIGACVMLGFIGSRGKTDGDRTLVWCGMGLLSAFGPLTQLVYNLGGFEDNPGARLLWGIFECTGWALFALGALHHELDLETPVGFPIRP